MLQENQNGTPEVSTLEFTVKLHSKKVHHGGQAVRAAKSKNTSAAARKLNSAVLSTNPALANLFGFNKSSSPKEETVKELKPYGHSGANNVQVLKTFSASVDTDWTKCQDFIDAKNALTLMQQWKCDGSSFNITKATRDYDQAKQGLLEKYGHNGIIVPEVKKAYLDELAGLAFVYYVHQVVVEIISDVSLCQHSTLNVQTKKYKTVFRSVCYYTRALLPLSMRQRLVRAVKEDFQLLFVAGDSTPLRVYRDSKGRLRATGRIVDAESIPGDSAVDDYT